MATCLTVDPDLILHSSTGDVLLKAHYASGWSRLHDLSRLGKIPQTDTKGLVAVLKKWKGDGRWVYIHYSLLVGCDYFSLKGIGPPKAVATLLHTESVTDTAAVLEAVEHVLKKIMPEELKAEYRKDVVWFIHPVIDDMTSEKFQTLSGSVLTPEITAVVGGVPADVTLHKAMALGAFDPETNENCISLSAQEKYKDCPVDTHPFPPIQQIYRQCARTPTQLTVDMVEHDVSMKSRQARKLQWRA